MGASSRTTFAKRQKERSRQEKRAEKLQRKADRKQVGDTTAPVATQPVATPGQPDDERWATQGIYFHDFGK